jgi:hypothetical protein
MLLPAASKTKAKDLEQSYLNNLKQLQPGCTIFDGDNQGSQLPFTNTVKLLALVHQRAFGKLREAAVDAIINGTLVCHRVANALLPYNFYTV